MMKRYIKLIAVPLGAFFSLVIGSLVSIANAEAFSDLARDPAELNQQFIRYGVDLPIKNVQEVFDGQGELNRQSVTDLLGSPNDPLAATDLNDWFYNINLPLSDDDYLVCQLKLSFSEQVLTSAQWRRQQCSTLLEALKEPAQQLITFSADLLFDFDSFVISSAGNEKISQAVQDAVSKFDAPSFLVTGHTDRLGSAEYNLQLSEKRARAVADAMTRNGISSRQISLRGRGESDPLVECAQAPNRNSLINCLAPNRRVEILINETR